MKRRYYSWTIILGIASILLLSCQDKTTSLRGYVIDPFKDSIEKDSIEAANIEIIKEIYMLVDEQNLEACIEMYSDSAKGFMGSSEESFTFEEIIPYIQMYYTAFPDYQHHIENIFAADDYVVAQLKYTGTHTSKFMEIDSTGNKIEYKGIFVFKFVDGKIAEQWGIEDDLTMMSQLGLELK
jgi:predicted ester cyclase